MRIVHLIPPGRFPTVVPDAGAWWSELSAAGRYSLERYSANASFWRVLCSAAPKQAFLCGLTFAQRCRRRLEWSAYDIDLHGSAAAANRSLDDLCRIETYQSRSAYLCAIGRLADHLSLLNRAQSELEFSLNDGVRVVGLKYDNSRSLTEYAFRDTPFTELVETAIADIRDDTRVVVLSVTSPEDLLSALIAARLLRERIPAIHVCLADHGYENFSLQPHIERLRTANTLTRLFHTIIASKDERDALVPAVVKAVETENGPRGILTLDQFPAPASGGSGQFVAPPPLPAFTPEPVFWTRISGRRCYWSRCTFCVQNNKYDDPKVPSLQEVPAALDRIEQSLRAGYRTFIFSDEALSPALLRQLCQAILKRGLRFRWACRCKMELSHTPDLFRLMADAGCYEILYGLESISPRVQQRMDKYLEGLDAPRVKQTLLAMHEAGIGSHVNLIGNFPGDTPEEVTASTEFLIDALRETDHATFLLNRFALFPETPVAQSPEKFGIAALDSDGDIFTRWNYRLTADLAEESAAVDELIPRLRERLMSELGWDSLGDTPAAYAAISLYFGSGHGSIFKTQSPNIFANPLKVSPHPLKAAA